MMEQQMTAGQWIAAIENAEIPISLHDALKFVNASNLSFADFSGDKDFGSLNGPEQVAAVLSLASFMLDAQTRTKIDFEAYNRGLKAIFDDCLERLK